MTLLLLIVVLLIGGVAAWWAERRSPGAARGIALAALVIDLVLGVGLWVRAPVPFELNGQGAWLAELNWTWIERFGIHFHLGLDGLSLLMVLLTVFLGLAAVVASWSEIKERVGFFHFQLLWALAGVVGVFLALDLFLFFLLWEVMLVPMYFLIALWGHEHRVYAAIKFFIFTQASSLLMLVAILALVFMHYQSTGTYSFDYFDLLGIANGSAAGFVIMLGFFIAFAVKLPMVPLHTWLPDAHTEAPTGGSVILAGILLKTGAYGLIRFVIPLFPEAALQFTPVAMTLGVIGILYGAFLAFAQTDVKRLVAYTSISHLGFVLLGIFAWNSLALHGVVVQMIAHGISTGALFIIAGVLQERLQTREMRQMGGLWSEAPRLGALTLLFAIASLGLPGLGNFVGEFLVLLGAYQVQVALTVLAALGLITAVVYALILIQRTFHGERSAGLARVQPVLDLTGREMSVMVTLGVIVVWLGLYPQPVQHVAHPAIEGLRAVTAEGASGVQR